MVTCPACGAIHVDVVFSTAHRQAIYDFIRRHPGCTMSDIIDWVYRDDPNGGPNSMNVISVTLHHMKPTLHALGVKIQASYGPGATYRIVKEI